MHFVATYILLSVTAVAQHCYQRVKAEAVYPGPLKATAVMAAYRAKLNQSTQADLRLLQLWEPTLQLS